MLLSASPVEKRDVELCGGTIFIWGLVPIPKVP